MKERSPDFWLLDGNLDFKITKLSGPNVTLVQEPKMLKRLFILMGDRQCNGMLVRYLKLRYPFIALLYYCSLIFICKFTGKKIFFFLHNFREHTSKNLWINDIVRHLIMNAACRVFVFDEQMKQVVPASSLPKTEVLGFGPMLAHLKSKQDHLTSEQKSQLSVWLSHGDVDIVSVTTARRTDLQIWLDAVPSNLRVLVIDPNEFCTSSGPNVFVLHGSVYSSWADILPALENSVCLLTHNNVSVPTSLYLFAEIGVPVLAADRSPIREIGQRENIGVVCGPCDIEVSFDQLSSVREVFSRNCREFSAHNSWDKSGSRLRVWL